MKDYSVLPSINSLLEDENFLSLQEKLGRDKFKDLISESLSRVRERIAKNERFSQEDIYKILNEELLQNEVIALKAVINGTGTLLHTNLGRAVLSKKVMLQVSELLTNYVNVEYDLKTGKRGKRGEYINQLLCNLTNAESAIVVNNNASATYLILNEFAKDRDVLVSRGELVEIGGSFRIPDIMSLSGATLKEVGTTNKTRINDYLNNIDERTSMLMKVHQSNYKIIGFTESVDMQDLALLAKEKKIVSYYDLGSGLISKFDKCKLEWDHTVKEVLAAGVDIVSFSGDKLLGATQAGLIVGKHEYITRLKKNPLYRVLRVGKLTDSVLYYTLKNYLNFDLNFNEIPFFQMLNQTTEDILFKAEKLLSNLKKDIKAKIVVSSASIGGGSMPGEKLPSYALEITAEEEKNVKNHLKLLSCEKAIIGYLYQGRLIIDLIAIQNDDLEYIAKNINLIY